MGIKTNWNAIMENIMMVDGHVHFSNSLCDLIQFWNIMFFKTIIHVFECVGF
jgi:hypothetical protein